MSTSPNITGDTAADLAARIGNWAVTNENQTTPTSNVHQNSANIQQYSNIHTPATQSASTFASPFASSDGNNPYLYWSDNTPAPFTPMPPAPASAWSYSGPDIPHAPISATLTEGGSFPHLGQPYTTPPVHHNGEQHGIGRDATAVRPFRPSHMMPQSIQQQHENIQRMQAMQNAQYYGFGDQRQSQFWGTPPQGIYVPTDHSRKKDQQIGHLLQSPLLPQTPHRHAPSQNPYATPDYLPHESGNYGYNNHHTPPYQSNAGQYGMQQHNPYTGLHTPYTPSNRGGRTSAPYRPKFRDFSEISPLKPKSALLEDFRLNKLQRTWYIKEIFGYVVEFCGDQHGSRFIQQRLESCTPADRDTLFHEMMPQAYELMTDVFGNYTIQKLFEVADPRQKEILVKKMEGNVVTLSLHMYGCRVVQKALEFTMNGQRDAIVKELEPAYVECIKSNNGNHVIQRLVMFQPPKSLTDALSGQVEELATHPFGCRVLQKMIENMSEDIKAPIMRDLHMCIFKLTENEFGNYVVQSIIQVGKDEDRAKVIGKLKGHLIDLCRHKYASNVCERAIMYGNSDDRRQLIEELIGLQSNGQSKIPMLLRDGFANFPVQTALKYAESDQQGQLLDLISLELPAIQHLPVGKRLASNIALMESESWQTATLLPQDHTEFSTPGSGSSAMSTADAESPEAGVRSTYTRLVPSQAVIPKGDNKTASEFGPSTPARSADMKKPAVVRKWKGT